jgi:hypothetical protein
MEDKVYAFVTEGDVFGTITVPGTEMLAERYHAGFSSGAIVVECTNYPDLYPGWTWDGEKFSPPTQPTPFLNGAPREQ